MKIGVSSKCGGKRLKGVLTEGSTKQPLVTVITAVFNGQPYVTGCLESVLSQDYPNIEHIVLDGGSSDGTLDVLRQFDDRIDLWKSEPDKGVYDAWNKGLVEARGEWISFLGADDVFYPGAIREYMSLALKNPEANFLSSRAQLRHPSGYSPVFGTPWTWPRASRSMPSVHVGSMHRRVLFIRHGQFDSTYRIAGDYEFLLRAREDLHAAFTPIPTVLMRAGGVSDSTAGLREARRAKLKHGVASTFQAECELRALMLRFYIRQIVIRVASFLNLSNFRRGL